MLLFDASTPDLSAYQPNYMNRAVVNMAAETVVDKVTIDLSGLCHEAENPSSPTRINKDDSAEKYISPAALIMGALKYRYKLEPTGIFNSVVLVPPAYGKIFGDAWIRRGSEYPSASFQLFVYVPGKDFYGADHVTFEVAVGTRKFRLPYKINVVPTSMNGDSCRTPVEAEARYQPTH